MTKLLFVTAEGIGNILQTLPAVLTLERVLDESVDLMIANSSFSVPDNLLIGHRIWHSNTLIPGYTPDYRGKVVTIWGHIHGKGHPAVESLKTLNSVSRQTMRLDRSEVDVYLNIAREFGIREDQFVFDVRDVIRTNNRGEAFDVVMCNGYNFHNTVDKWEAKSYPYMPEVARRFQQQGLSVASIGGAQQYVEGTEDCTEWPLLDSLGLIQRCKLVVSTDSGMYHAGCILRKPTIVLFTFTCFRKNYDKRFHATACALRRKPRLPCVNDCHAKHRWKSCADAWACREIDVQYIMDKSAHLLQRTQDDG